MSSLKNQMNNLASERPAWVEIDLDQLRTNFDIIRRDMPAGLGFVSVVKDEAYGHGMVQVARTALQFGATAIALATVDEALQLRQNQVYAPILVFGERTEEELEICVTQNFTCFINDRRKAEKLSRLAKSAGKRMPIHVEVDTGLSRYGVKWSEAPAVIVSIAGKKHLHIEGVMSHFAMSDELDKTFALQQLERFRQVMADLQELGIEFKYRHMCNTGGFLDLPQAHFDLVRIGILPLGVYPSQVCRRIRGLLPIMTVKTKIAAITEIEAGDYIGYGMRYQAVERRRIAVLPVGYGDGFPRVRNQGEVLICDKRAPVVGGNAMDATMVDVTDIPQAQVWNEVVLMGKQGDEEIDVHEIARLQGTVSYHALTGWRSRLPRIYLGEAQS